MLRDGDPATVVLDRHAAIGVDGHRDALGESRHRLVDRVVDDLVHQMVQPAMGSITDVHPRPLADVLQVRKMLQIFVGVLGIGCRSDENRRIRGGIFRKGGVAHEFLLRLRKGAGRFGNERLAEVYRFDRFPAMRDCHRRGDYILAPRRDFRLPRCRNRPLRAISEIASTAG